MLFSEFVRDYQGGKLDEILGAELKNITEQVEKLGRKGTLSLSVEMKPAGINQMNLVANYNAKPPVNNSVSSVMFVDKTKALVNDDPYQQKLELKLTTMEETVIKTKAI